jgi:hypothetical protein
MKKKLLFLLPLIPLFVIAADTNAPAVNIDAKITNWFSGFAYWSWLLIPATTAFIEAFKKYVVRIPSVWQPILAPFIGAGLDFLAQKAGLWTGSLATGALFGMAGVWFHQLGTQVTINNQAVDNNTANTVTKTTTKTTTPPPIEVTPV